MRKHAIIVGNNEGLPGVKKDLQNICTYLKSNKGGVWSDSEIRIFNNSSRTDLIIYLDMVKCQDFDYLFFYFSGHGSQKRGVQLYLNETDELINESEIVNLASKQLTIFDCCRGKFEPQVSLDFSELNESYFLSFKQFELKHKFENKIMTLPPQQIILYSCSVGEFSIDTADGGLYTKNIINSAQSNNDEYINIIDVHSSAAKIVYAVNNKQKPDYQLPKLFKNDQLIFGIN